MKQKNGTARVVDGAIIIGLVTLCSCTENYGASTASKKISYDTAIVRKTVGGDVYIDTGGHRAADVYIYDNNSPNPPVVAKKGDTIVYQVDSFSKVTVDTLLPKKKKSKQ
jgi:hypothetical protein